MTPTELPELFPGHGEPADLPARRVTVAASDICRALRRRYHQSWQGPAGDDQADDTLRTDGEW